MRIAFDARCYNGSGVGTYVRELLKGLAQLRSGLEVVILESPGNPVPVPHSPWISRAIVRSTRFSIKEQFELPAICRSLNIDVFHLPFQYGAPLMLPCPMIITVHDLIPFLFRTRSWPIQLTAVPFVRLAYRSAALKANHVITPSRRTAQDLQSMLGVSLDRITAIHLGADASSFHANASREELEQLNRNYGVRMPYVVVGSAGNWRTKNLRTSLQALALARQITGAGFQTVVYGLDKGIDLLVQRHSTFGLDLCRTGYVSVTDLGALFRHAQLFICSPLYEGFGLPAVEAMSCGCPVVSSNAGSLPEVIGAGGQMFDPTDADGMAQAVASLLTKPEELETWRARALDRATRFSWRKCAEQTIAVYRSVYESACERERVLDSAA